MSATFPQWVEDALPLVKALCPPDAEPKLTDDEIATAIIANTFVPLADDDPADEPFPDIYAAVHDCWMLKAGKVAGDYDFDEAGMRDSASQVHAQCLKMADRYNPVGIA